MVDRQYYVYIMTNKHDTVLYTGVTNDLNWNVGHWPELYAVNDTDFDLFAG